MSLLNHTNRGNLLFSAIKDGDCQLVKLLIYNGVNVNKPQRKSHYTVTPLYVAVSEQDNVEIVKILLRANARIHDYCGNRSPLDVACAQNKVDIVRCLLEHGANVNRASSAGALTPLHTASINGALACVNLLLDSGANVNMVNDNGQTALYYAYSKNHIAVAQELKRVLVHFLIKLVDFQSNCPFDAGQLTFQLEECKSVL